MNENWLTRESAIDIKLQLCNKLEQIRARDGMTQKQFADRVGIYQARVSDIKNGRISRFTIDYLLSILERCGFTIDVKIRGRHRSVLPTSSSGSQPRPARQVLPIGTD